MARSPRWLRAISTSLLCLSIVLGTSSLVRAAPLLGSPGPRIRSSSRTTSSPPRADGYFVLRPPGSWSTLPTGRTCRKLIHYSTWEPRPENDAANHTVPDRPTILASFQARPRTAEWVNWNSWLLPRVSGNFTGTTDEILQWAACKWGLSDNMVRAVTAAESTWYQYLTYPSGRCVTNRGCGDLWASDPAYCAAVATFGRDYQQDYGPGTCPGTFSIAGVMSYQSPAWGRWPDDQNGAFPFNRDSTAFAVDYMAASVRGCYEGWYQWLWGSYPTYAAGDIWGCVGTWYSGAWHTPAADAYIATVKGLMANRVWLQSGWMKKQYACDPVYGCPD